MSSRSTALLKAGLNTLYYTRGHKLLQPFTRGVGTIFTLHHVTPEPHREFEPNRILRITPEFLEETIVAVKEAGHDIVSLDEAHWRLTEGAFERPFACFTFDDGYRDNLVHAYPVFRRHSLPFTIYVPSAYADGAADLWWLGLERLIAEVDDIRLKIDGELRQLHSSTPQEKSRTFHEIYWWLRSIDENEARATVKELCRSIGLDTSQMSRDLVMTWDEVRRLAGDPLVTIGAHTRGHYALAKLSEAEARFEILEGTRRIEQELGVRPRHMSYPYGSESSAGAREFRLAREAGFKTAVTTRKGLVYAEHSDHLTALPRVSLNGDYQSRRYLDVFLSGAPFLLWNGLKRVDAA
ncbi:MAG: polysaccharide deacetylase family protein [Hyphomicrobiaceae bacterium]